MTQNLRKKFVFHNLTILLTPFPLQQQIYYDIIKFYAFIVMKFKPYSFVHILRVKINNTVGIRIPYIQTWTWVFMKNGPVFEGHWKTKQFVQFSKFLNNLQYVRFLDPHCDLAQFYQAKF